jgi:hypothetical protein
MVRGMAVRSCGQALLWSCCVDLAHGIVWANHDYLLEFAGRSLQTGMPTWRAFTRGAVPGCVTTRYAASRDGSVKDVACRAWTNAPSKTKSFTFLMGYTALVLETRTRPSRLHTKKVKRGAASGLTIVARPPSRLRSQDKYTCKVHSISHMVLCMCACICMAHEPHGMAGTIVRHKHVPVLRGASQGFPTSFLASNFAAWLFDRRALSASSDSSGEGSQQASSNVLFRSECHWSLCCHEYRHVIRCSRPRSRPVIDIVCVN